MAPVAKAEDTGKQLPVNPCYSIEPALNTTAIPERKVQYSGGKVLQWEQTYKYVCGSL